MQVRASKDRHQSRTGGSRTWRMRPPPGTGWGPLNWPSWASELALARATRISWAACLFSGLPPHFCGPYFYEQELNGTTDLHSRTFSGGRALRGLWQAVQGPEGLILESCSCRRALSML